MNEKQELEELELDKKDMSYIQLSQWSNFFHFPSHGAMRNIVARRKENGADEFLIMIHGRFYIDVRKFDEWMQKKKEPASKRTT